MNKHMDSKILKKVSPVIGAIIDDAEAVASLLLDEQKPLLKVEEGTKFIFNGVKFPPQMVAGKQVSVELADGTPVVTYGLVPFGDQRAI